MKTSELPATAAVLVAAGASTRLGAHERKPFLELAGRTLLEHAAAAFDACAAVRELVVVAREEDLSRVRALAVSSPALAKLTAVVAGGPERADSVRAGLAACGRACRLVAVHDAARPLVTPGIVERAIAAAAERGAALVAIPVQDTLKSSRDGQHAESTLERAGVWRAQTPQVFELASIRELADRAAAEGWRPTDESALHERYVGPVALVEGSPDNFKITTLEELHLAEALLAQRAEAAR